MPIRKIKEVKLFGIFKNYAAGAELHEFEQFNLFYGWNGSGKSTLSMLLSCLTQRSAHESYPDGKFKVAIENGGEISNQNLQDCRVNIHVFNADFVRSNVDFANQRASSILVLSEERIEETRKYKELQSEIKEDRKTIDNKSDELERVEKELEKLYSDGARQVKRSFELIQTSDNKLLNYNAPKLKTFLSEHSTEISPAAILDRDEVTRLMSAIKPIQKPDIDSLSLRFDESKTVALLVAMQVALARTVISERIERLIANPEINNWVERGLGLHRESDSCEFCQNRISPERKSALNAHFSNEYQSLLKDLAGLKKETEAFQGQYRMALPDAASFYDELHSECRNLLNETSGSINQIQAMFDMLNFQLIQKLSNPFASIALDIGDLVVQVRQLPDLCRSLSNLIDTHNAKNKKFQELVSADKMRLELHFVSDFVIQSELVRKRETVENRRTTVAALEEALLPKKAEHDRLEAILVTEVKGAERFNESLAKFLGRDDIFLHFDPKAKGYRLLRGEDRGPAINLSEGEKTAVAFVYFVTKLREGDNQIRDSVIVLDDPISSFDSNHLFHSHAFIKSELEAAKQLFILTHNFQFFRLIRDWIERKNKYGDNPKIRSRFFVVEVLSTGGRSSIINNAPDSLMSYSSEYHYLFQRLVAIEEKENLDLDNAFLAANLSRKLLEGFLSFKFPKKRSDFYALLIAGCADAQRRERVYRFINKYSHSDSMEPIEPAIDNILGEGGNIVTEVFNIMRDLDANHLVEMREVSAPVARGTAR